MESFGIAFVIKQLLSWRSVIDVALMSAILFFLYRTVIRLGTWKIVSGIIIAMVLFLLAGVLDLKAIEWVYRNVSQVAVIALIIIFQPELRKLFERAASIRRTESRAPWNELSSLLDEATMSLARQKRGAIIVIPGREPVNEWLDGGYKLEAKPSLPLIMSIFDPHSPGHDGALVIQDGLFSRFGVRLPTSDSDTLPESYGTRHHAAMGLAERTDALVIVVSEERGKISYFRHGNFKQVTDMHPVAEIILEHWKESATYAFDMRRRKRKGPLLTQLSASVLVALLFWAFLITGQGEITEKVLSVPVQFTGLPPGLFLAGEKSDEARVHLAGPAADMNNLSASQVNVNLDLSSATAGKQNFVVTGQNLRLPKGIQLMEVTPSSIQVTLVAIVEREITVVPQMVGRLAQDLKLDQVTVKPRKVLVRMPAGSDKNQEPVLTTTPIYLESIRSDTKLFGKIIAPPSVQPVDKGWPDVEISVQVQTK